MWGTERTATCTRQEGQGAILIAVDHDAAACGGIHAATQGTRFAAWEPIRQGVGTYLGAWGQAIAQGLALRHDHGSQERSQVLQAARTFVGSASSPACVRAPEGNGGAKRFIRTLKEHLLWRKTFETVEDLRLARHEFQRQDNATWLIGRHGDKAPTQVRHEPQCALADAASF
jgi:putative transposase